LRWRFAIYFALPQFAAEQFFLRQPDSLSGGVILFAAA